MEERYYNVEEGAPDFFAELLNDDKDDDENEHENQNNKCLITFQPLAALAERDRVRLDCGHGFTYGALFQDVLNHKRVFNASEVRFVEPGQVRCPYCRSLHNGVLPQHPQFARIYGVNYLWSIRCEVLGRSYWMEPWHASRWSCVLRCQHEELSQALAKAEEGGGEKVGGGGGDLVAPCCGFIGSGQLWRCLREEEGEDGVVVKKDMPGYFSAVLCIKHAVCANLDGLLRTWVVMNLEKQMEMERKTMEFDVFERCTHILKTGKNKGKRCARKSKLSVKNQQKCLTHCVP